MSTDGCSLCISARAAGRGLARGLATAALGALVALAPGAGVAESPLSAIDWLSDSLTSPVTPPGNGHNGAKDGPISTNALPGEVSVSDLSGPLPDAIGLLPTSVTGLPSDLWGKSLTGDLAIWLGADRADMLPAMQDLLYTLLLAELDAPADASPRGAKLLLARIDTLLSLGALEQARAMLKLLPSQSPETFRRFFDVSLLLRTEDEACAVLKSSPSLSPTFPARVFCLARGGDWSAAVLSLETGRALGLVSEFEDALLSRFLDPVLFEGEPPLVAPARPSPLVFRLLEAIGEPLPTAGLPLAFAWADLHANTGWRTQIEAAERLVRTGAVDPNRLLGLYSERHPAASGGVWDRVRAIQALERALASRDRQALASALNWAWEEMAGIELEVAFAHLFAHRLSGREMDAPTRALAFRVALLSDGYETAARAYEPQTDRERIARAIATGAPGTVRASDPMVAAIQDGFRADGIPVRLQSLIAGDRLGEAILRAIALFGSGARGNYDELTDALAFFRAVGFEDLARRAALQLIVLDPRG